MRGFGTRRGVALPIACVVAVSAPNVAAASRRDEVPPEFRAACGRPGTEVRATRAILGPVRIKHRDCDLRRTIVFGVGAGVEVPSKPGGNHAIATTYAYEEQITAVVAPRTLDVTITLVVSPRP